MNCSNWTDHSNSFDGKIKYFEDISVDNFYDKNKKAYFLSHFHSDHYGGLVGGRENSHAEEHISKGPMGKKIYMTETTKIILKSKYPSDYKKLLPIIETLETGKTHANLNNLGIDVTLQEVTHMPGAVMFMFAKASCRVLYTGDFVMKTKDEKELKDKFQSLHDGSGNPFKFNYMYYDDTFECKGILPTRAQCIENLVTKINNWLNLHENNVVELITYYDYGFEELFAEVSMRMVPPMKIYNNDQEQMEVYDEILDREQNVYTSEMSTSRIFHQNYEERKYELPAGKESLPITISTLNWKSNSESYPFPTHCGKDQLDVFKKYFEVIPPGRPDGFKLHPGIERH